MKKDYERIKDVYGENMAKLCRTLFPTILQKDHVLFSILTFHFAPNRFLYDDLIHHDCVDSFKNYIYSFYHSYVEHEDVHKSVRELFNDAGYDFYECYTDKDILSFKKYYQPDESLCTFYEDRLSSHFVFWAVKKNVDDIKRENFLNPSRDDLYGTSVISLQFSRGIYNILSIKNRYNHIVDDSDATFSNNLENIAVGLTKAFEKEYQFHIVVSGNVVFNLPGYKIALDGKFYKFNLEIRGVYYCPNNIIIDHGKVIQLDLSRYLLVDYFIIDMKDKKISLYDKNIDDYFVHLYTDIRSIKVLKDESFKRIVIMREFMDDVFIDINQYSQMISFKDSSLQYLGRHFLKYNIFLMHFYCPNLEIVGDQFLNKNIFLKDLDCPNLRIIGDGFLSNNYDVEAIKLPKVIKVGNDFLCQNGVLKSLYAPKVKEFGSNCLCFNHELKRVNFPNLIVLGHQFLLYNEYSLKEFYAPKLKIVGNDFLHYNVSLRKLCCESLESAGKYFLANNKILKDYQFPRLSSIDMGFMERNVFWKEHQDEKKKFMKSKKVLVKSKYHKY